MLNRKEFYRRVLSDESASLWVKKQIKIRREARQKRIRNFIQKELKYVLPKNKQNLEQLLGDFTKSPPNISKPPLTAPKPLLSIPVVKQIKMNSAKQTKVSSMHESTNREIYSREISNSEEFFLPATNGLQNLEKLTISPNNVKFDVKRVLFKSCLSPSQEKFQTHIFKKFKRFLNDYDPNKSSNNGQKAAKAYGQLQSKEKDDLEIPFVGRYLPGKKEEVHEVHEDNKSQISIHNQEGVESLKAEKSDKYKELTDLFKSKWLKKGEAYKPKENDSNDSKNWVGLSRIEKRTKAFSLSMSGFSKHLNISEEKGKINKFLIDTLKVQQAKQHQKQPLSFSFHNLNMRQKFQGNRYNQNLFQNFS